MQRIVLRHHMCVPWDIKKAIGIFWSSLVFACALSVGSVLAQDWEPVPLRTPAQQLVGIPGGEGMQMIWGLSYAPSDPQVLYLVSDTSQVWKSTDGGHTWKMKNKGFWANGGLSLAVDHNNKDIVLVAGSRHHLTETSPDADGIYRTVNGGDTWERVWATPFYRLNDKKGGVNFAFTPNAVYAGTHTEGLLKSLNSGKDWTRLGILENSKILDVKVHPQDPSVLFIAAESGLHKVTDSDGNVTVQPIGNLPDIPRSIAINPIDPNIIFVTVGVPGVYKSQDGGTSFSPANTGLFLTNQYKPATYLAMSPLNPNRLYVSYYQAGGNHPYYTNDGGDKWYKPSIMDNGGLISEVNRGTGGAYFGSLTVPSPVDAETAITTAAGEHLEMTTDGGNSWTYLSNGYSGGRAGVGTTSFSWDPNNPDRFALFLIDFSPVVTQNGGATFTALPIPRYSGARTTPVGALDPTPGSNVIVTAVGGWTSQVLAVSVDGGQNWTLHDGNNGTKNTVDNYNFIAFHPQNANIIYAGKYKSEDKGATWNELGKKVVAMYAQNGEIVYATDMSGTTLTISKSTDGGVTWSQPYGTVNISNGVPGEIVVDPTDPNRLYVTGLWGGVHVWNGSAWSTKGEADGIGLDHFGSLSTHNITIDPNYPNVVYAGKWIAFYGHADGVYRSVDHGENWENITANLGTEFTPWALSVNPHNGYIYMGSSHGTWRLPPPYSDGDGDRILDDGDFSHIVGDNPCTAGNKAHCDDNCPTVANPDQADSNGNGVGDACDPVDLTLSIANTPDPALLGNTVTYALTVTNLGPSPASGVTLTGTLLSCDLGTLASGASASCTRTVTANTAGTLSQTMTASAAEYDPVIANNTVTVNTSVLGSCATTSGFKISGKVIQGKRTAVPGVTMNLLSSNLACGNRTTTASDGTYTFPKLPNATYKVTPSGGGCSAFDPPSREVTVSGRNNNGEDFKAICP